MGYMLRAAMGAPMAVQSAINALGFAERYAHCLHTFHAEEWVVYR